MRTLSEAPGMRGTTQMWSTEISPSPTTSKARSGGSLSRFNMAGG
ncbi:MAG: hypothetical protein QM765_25420 [Myxococcales bacterium]